MIQEGSSKLASVPSGGGGAASSAAAGGATAAAGETAPAEEEKKEEEKEESDEDVRNRLSMSLMFRWDSDCSIRAQESSVCGRPIEESFRLLFIHVMSVGPTVFVYRSSRISVNLHCNATVIEQFIPGPIKYAILMRPEQIYCQQFICIRSPCLSSLWLQAATAPAPLI